MAQAIPTAEQFELMLPQGAEVQSVHTADLPPNSRQQRVFVPVYRNLLQGRALLQPGKVTGWRSIGHRSESCERFSRSRDAEGIAWLIQQGALKPKTDGKIQPGFQVLD